jgi:hypothetical protein
MCSCPADGTALAALAGHRAMFALRRLDELDHSWLAATGGDASRLGNIDMRSSPGGGILIGSATCGPRQWPSGKLDR